MKKAFFLSYFNYDWSFNQHTAIIVGYSFSGDKKINIDNALKC